MRGVVRRAELARAQAGQRLHLVAAGEERELVGIAARIVAEPLRRERERLVPLDLAELARAALAGCAAAACVSRAGEYCFMMPAEPFAQITPWLTGCSGLPSM